jgi:prepilin-type N-terminal cleavage/methylation domain-containing protein
MTGNREGFTLVEVIVSIVLLSVILTGLAGLTFATAQQAVFTTNAATRQALSLETVNRFSTLPYDSLAGYATMRCDSAGTSNDRYSRCVRSTVSGNQSICRDHREPAAAQYIRDNDPTRPHGRYGTAQPVLQPVMLRARAGFTLIEVIVALVLTAVVGAAITSVFITQSKFYDHAGEGGLRPGRIAWRHEHDDERVAHAGAGQRRGQRRFEPRITVRAPYALGLACDNSPFTVAVIPADTFMMNDAKFAGYAYRLPNGAYHYEASSTQPSNGSVTECDAGPAVGRFPASEGGRVLTLTPAAPSTVVKGTPVPVAARHIRVQGSEEVPGRLGLWREIER